MPYFSKSFWKNKWTEAGFRKYFQNTSWMFASRLFTLSISFLTTIYIARQLGPLNYGALSYAVSFTGLFGFLSSLGIDGILQRDLIRYPDRKKEFLGTALLIRLIAGLATAAAISLIAFYYFASSDVSTTLIFILSGTFILNAFQIILLDFRARADSKYPSIVAFAISLTLNLSKVVAIATGRGIIYLAMILLMESLLYAVFFIYIYGKKSGHPVTEWKFDRLYSISLLKDSFPLVALGAFSVIYARIDQVLIKHMINTESVGLYDAAVRIAELWSFIPGVIVAALYPAIVNAKKTAEDLYNKRLGKLLLLLASLAIIISTVVTVLAPYIMDILYGNTFRGGIPVLQIYVWSSVGTFLGILVIQYLITENFRRILTFVGFLPMFVNVLLNLLWIPSYGITGAAYATLISYSLTPLSLLFFNSTRKRVIAIYKSFYEKNT